MSQEINLGGTIYISSRRGAEITGYSQDYIGQLARSGAIDARRVSGLWYILESSLLAHKEKAEKFIPIPPQKIRESEQETSIYFEGKDYISASRASDISGYNPDYVTQLAREGKIVAHQSANRWYVDRESLLAHKKEKDSLLAAVQSEAVGIRDNGEILIKIDIDNTESISHFKYIRDESIELVPLKKDSKKEEIVTVLESVDESEQNIPIRIVKESNYVTERAQRSPETGSRRQFYPTMRILLVSTFIIGSIFSLMNFSDQFVTLKESVSFPRFVERFVSKELVFSRESDF